MQACLRGERAAQEQLYAQFAAPLLSVCQRYARTSAQAEDILQEAYIRIFRSLALFRGEGPLEAWMRRIVVRTAINHYHAGAVEKAEVGLNADAFGVCADDNNALAQLSVQDILGLIHQLPDGYRLVMNLFCFEGYSHREIADLLGIEEKSSSSQLFKARQRLLLLLRRAEYAL